MTARRSKGGGGRKAAGGGKPKARSKSAGRGGRGAASAKRKAAPKPAAKAAEPRTRRKRRIAAGHPEAIGEVTHYFPAAGAGALALSGALAVGDAIHVRGQTTDFFLVVESLTLEGRAIDQADAGQEVGLGTPHRVRPGDRVYRISW